MRFLAPFFLLAILFATSAGAIAGESATALPPLFPPGREELRPEPQAVAAQVASRLAASQGNVAALETALDGEIRNFRQLFDQATAFRQRNRELAAELNLRRAAKLPLRGGDLDRLNQNLCEGIAITRALFTTADLNAFWLDPDKKALARAKLPPALPLELRAKGNLLALASTFFLYDTYRDNVNRMLENDKVCTALMRGDSGYSLHQRLLHELAAEYLSPANRLQARRELAFCSENLAAATARYGADENFRFLCDQIAQSSSRPYFASSWFTLPFRSVKDHAAVRATQVGEDVKGLGEDSLNGVSLAFGNTVGLVAIRKGKLYGNPTLTRLIAAQLRAGDIVLEKTPFRLTDRFIPGHWGHAAIWIGDEADLRQLGIWDDPLLLPHQARIRDGGRIIEALRDGKGAGTPHHQPRQRRQQRPERWPVRLGVVLSRRLRRHRPARRRHGPPDGTLIALGLGSHPVAHFARGFRGRCRLVPLTRCRVPALHRLVPAVRGCR